MSIKENVTSSASALDLKTSVGLIPEFNTSQSSEVYRFVRCCNAAFRLAKSSDHEVLLVYALNRIIGPSSADVHAKQYKTWDELQTFLIEKFSNVKTVSHLCLELQSMFQRDKETVTEYFHRVDLLRSKIIEKLIAEIEDESLLGRQLSTEEMALNVFVNGLNSDLGTMLRTKEFKKLSDAGRFAMQEDKIRAMNSARQTLYKASLAMTKPTNNSRFLISQSTTQRPPRPFNPPSNLPPNNKICNYCKNPGHLIHECRKRAFNNQRFNQMQSNQPKRVIPLPESKVSHLNSQAAFELGNSMETVSAHFPSTLMSNSIQTKQLEPQDFENLQISE